MHTCICTNLNSCIYLSTYTQVNCFLCLTLRCQKIGNNHEIFYSWTERWLQKSSKCNDSISEITSMLFLILWKMSTTIWKSPKHPMMPLVALILKCMNSKENGKGKLVKSHYIHCFNSTTFYSYKRKELGCVNTVRASSCLHLSICKGHWQKIQWICKVLPLSGYRHPSFQTEYKKLRYTQL